MKKILAIITARAGSKRIKNKNMRLLHGKPLIQWTIDAALESKVITHICVTTDDQNILGLADGSSEKIKFFNRPQELADDTASSMDVLLNAMQQYDESFDAVLLLQPTSPLRTAVHIDQAFDQFFKKGSSFLVSVREPADHMNHVVQRRADGLVSMLPFDANYFVLNGAIYIGRWNLFLKKKNFIQPDTDLFLMDELVSVDIDTESDWVKAETVFANKNA